MRRDRAEAATMACGAELHVDGALLPALGAGREAHGLLRRAEQRPRLVGAFAVFVVGRRIVDDSGAGLHMHLAVLDHRGAQHDAGVHLAGGAEIADAAGIDAALVLLQFVYDLHRPYLRRAGDGAGGKAGGERCDDVGARIEYAFDMRNDMHHMAVALDEETIRHFDRTDLGDAADVVAAKIEQHEMLGALLGIDEEFSGELLVLLHALAPPARAGDRPDRDLAVAYPNQDFRAGDHDLEAAEIEIAKIGRRIDATQSAIEREGRQVELAGVALRQHHLEYVAGDDVFLRLLDHGVEFRLGRIGLRFARHQRGIGGRRGMGQWTFEYGDDRVQSRLRALVGGARGDARRRTDRRHDGNLVAYGVEDDHDGRTDEERIGHADRVGFGGGQSLHLAHHVIAEIAENAGGHRRQARRYVDTRFGEKGAQSLQGFGVARREGVAIDKRAAIDCAGRAAGAPDDVGIEADHGIAAALRAAFDGFQEKDVP